VTIIPGSADGNLFGGKTDEELEQLLAGLTENDQLATEVPVEIPEPPPQKAVPAEVPPVQEATPETAPEPTSAEPPELTDAELAAMEAKAESEKLKAQLQLLTAHSSRLAGEIGFLKQQKTSQPSPEPYQPETEAEISQLTALQREVHELKQQQTRAAVERALAEGLAPIEAMPDMSRLVEYTKDIAPRYAQQFNDAREVSDPNLARQMATAIALTIRAEALEAEAKAKRTGLEQRRAESSANLKKAKTAATISASGAVPAPTPKQKDFRDMTAEEADRWLRENVS
jgi:hypothetical protein